MGDAPRQEDWTRGPGAWAAAVAAVVVGGLGLRAGLDRAPVPTIERSERAASGIVVVEPPTVTAVAGGARTQGLTAAAPTTDAASITSALATLPPTYVDVNSATSAELELLPGIGPALAGRIIASREGDGPFGSVDDLQRVKGIGPKTVEKLRAYAAALPVD